LIERGGHAAPRAPAGRAATPERQSRASRGPRREPRPVTRRARARCRRRDRNGRIFFRHRRDARRARGLGRPAGSRRGPAALIAELCRAAGGAIALISVRSIADIDRLVRGPPAPGGGPARHRAARRAGRITRHAGASLRARLGTQPARDRGRAASRIVARGQRAYRWPFITAGAGLERLRHRLMRSAWPARSATVLCADGQTHRGDEACRQGQGVACWSHAGGAVPWENTVFIGDDTTDEIRLCDGQPAARPFGEGRAGANRGPLAAARRRRGFARGWRGAPKRTLHDVRSTSPWSGTARSARW